MQAATQTQAAIQNLSKRMSSKIHHVVIIVQENRTTNNLFNGLPGADTVRTGKNSEGNQVTLRPELLTAPYDVGHTHRSFNTEFSSGQLNGFNRVVSRCRKISDVSACGYARLRVCAQG